MKQISRGFSNILFIICITSILLFTASSMTQIKKKSISGFENEAIKNLERKNVLNDSMLAVMDENGSEINQGDSIAFISNQGSKDATNITAHHMDENGTIEELALQRTSLPPDQNTTMVLGATNEGDKIIITSKQGLYITTVTQ
ncbi:MAG: hypothetical protein J7K00_04260 [Candidatus Diapherotrites archaeon]|nr:hypothetical protein [Candidatus Diapherotrites archaeon]